MHLPRPRDFAGDPYVRRHVLLCLPQPNEGSLFFYVAVELAPDGESSVSSLVLDFYFLLTASRECPRPPHDPGTGLTVRTAFPPPLIQQSFFRDVCELRHRPSTTFFGFFHNFFLPVTTTPLVYQKTFPTSFRPIQVSFLRQAYRNLSEHITTLAFCVPNREPLTTEALYRAPACFLFPHPTYFLENAGQMIRGATPQALRGGAVCAGGCLL